ncbi:hypothetical protein Rcae01_03019 [Novipirellula caenicola]|uniref:Uncharacterized protein n=1 Tax=Novipirellula caenicola TaxID=1536901 RepID=A0ABP9VVK6_9BACT
MGLLNLRVTHFSASILPWELVPADTASRRFMLEWLPSPPYLPSGSTCLRNLKMSLPVVMINVLSPPSIS